MTNFLALAACLATFAWTEGEAGPRAARAASFSALVALLPLLFQLLRPRWRRPADLARVVLAAVFAALFYREAGAVRFLALAAALAVAGAGRPANDPLARSLPVAALTFAAALFIRDHLPLWIPLASVSQWLSAHVAGALGTHALWGPTRVGAWSALGGVALAVGTFAALGRRALGAAAGAAILAVLACPGAVALELLQRRGLPPFLPPTAAPVLITLLLLVPLAWLARAHSRLAAPGDAAHSDAAPERAGPRLVAAGALALAGLALLGFARGYPVHRPRVLLDGRGAFGMEALSWGKYGPNAPQGASLATLPELLGAYGYPFARSDSTLTAERLAGHDVLVVMNPTQEFAPAELAAVWKFVADGGGLLVLGDHTNILGTGAALHSLLAPVGIRVRFDCAIPLVDRWTWYGCMRVHPHPVLRDVRDETDVKISVGASLDLPRRAFPLLTGRDAYSDRGDTTNARGAYLGNMRPDEDERWGDVVLAAEATRGRGKVIVFGDTSTFQRSAVTYSGDLILRILTYLGTRGAALPPFGLRAAGAGALALGGAAFLAAAPPSAAIAALAVTSALLATALDRLAHVAIPEVETSKVAWVDLAHGNRVDIHAGRDDGIGGLCDHLSRHGFLPLAMKRFDANELRGARAYVTVAPAFPFSPAERAALDRFVRDGGLLLVGAGFREIDGAKALLADFGFRVDGLPLGAAHEAMSRIPGTSLIMHESWPVVANGPADVLAEAWGYPIVALRRVGKGSVLVIGDSYFLEDAMLESPERFNELNIDFLRRAIEQGLAPAPEKTS